MAAIPKAQNTRPPEKGSFPLDHGGECRPHMKAFLGCLEENDNDHLPCKGLSKLYLACRMDRNLMAREEFDKLGFSTDEDYERIRKGAVVQEGDKEAKGFLGGVNVRGGRWFRGSKKSE